MKHTETLFHLFVLILIITIGIALTSCMNWTPINYMDPLLEKDDSHLEKVVLDLIKVPLVDDCFIGSSSDECVDFVEVVEVAEVVELTCNMDLCT